MPSDLPVEPDEMLARLRAHRLLGDLPEHELAWLVRHGSLRRIETGESILPPDRRADELFVVLSGRFAIYVDRGAGPRRTMEWRGGDVTGLLPYSRLKHSPGRATVEETTELLVVHRNHFTEMIRECGALTTKLVHVMLDRARNFTTHDLHDEKMLSLGKLAAGLAHELDNPGAAIMRSARLLASLTDEADAAAIALGEAHIAADQLAAVRRLKEECLTAQVAQVRSPLEQSRHEEAIADWLDDRGINVATVQILSETPITLEMLDAIEREVSPEVLQPALRWVAAACAVRTIVAEIGQAAARISELVKGIKAFTHVDEAATPGPVDVRRAVSETLAVLRPKAKGKAIRVTTEVEEGLPPVDAVGGELNQVLSNLIDNALDAAPEGGHVQVSARREGAEIVVRIVDDGPGVPAELRDRIFDPFFTTKPVGEGTGLGLDIVRKLVSRQGGRVELFSSPGRTEFRVTLPKGGAGPQAPAASESSEDGPAGAAAASPSPAQNGAQAAPQVEREVRP